MSSGSGVQLAFKLIPKLFSAVEVRGWPLEFFHTNLCTTCFNEPCFVHGSIAALEQVCSSSWLLHCFQLMMILKLGLNTQESILGPCVCTNTTGATGSNIDMVSSALDGSIIQLFISR